MGFRFSKSLKIIPGVRVNFGKNGASVSVGGKGATLNFSNRGIRTTVGIPGTGISYNETHGSKQQSNLNAGGVTQNSSGLLIKILLIGFFIWVIYRFFG